MRLFYDCSFSESDSSIHLFNGYHLVDYAQLETGFGGIQFQSSSGESYRVSRLVFENIAQNVVRFA